MLNVGHKYFWAFLDLPPVVIYAGHLTLLNLAFFFLNSWLLAEDKFRRRRAISVIPFSITQINLPTALVISMIIRLFPVPVGISEIRTICRAAINPIQLIVMSVPLYPDPTSVTAAFVHQVVYELAFFL